MARINSNISSLIARSNLNRANDDLQLRLQRLSTGLKINRGADDPAGLIISERLRSEISGLNQAVNNSDRASSVIATTEASLGEVSDLLNSIKGLVVEAANTGAISDAERDANQKQIDSAIESITRISNSSSFGGLKLLNGSLDYVLSGLRSDQITKARVSGANFAGQNNIQVNVRVLNSAQTGNLFLRTDTGVFVSASTIEVEGPKGVQTLQIAAGQPAASVISAVNQFKDATGISASLVNAGNPNSGVRFSTTGYGSKSFVSVKRLDDPPTGSWWQTIKLRDDYQFGSTFSIAALNVADYTSASRDVGRDVQAIINGNVAFGDGLKVSIQNQTSLSIDLELQKTFGLTVNPTGSTFNITGGGALYQLGGQINASQQTNIGIQSVAASKLGGTLIGSTVQFLDSIRSGGANDLKSKNFSNASAILDASIDEVSSVRGRLGAFEKNTLQTNVRSLQAAVENLTASESRIRDADFAAETSALTRAQILSSASTNVLQLANQQSQNVLQLLRQ